MNTTTAKAAAQAAGVTVATIRTWCRAGAVKATKTKAGRWVIDTASLAYRINLPALLRKAKKAVVLSVETLVAIGGRRWTNPRTGQDRVYLNDWPTLAGLKTSLYGTGNIASASYQGNGISNSQAYKILGAMNKVWFDAADGKIHGTYGHTNPRMTREQVWADINTGIRTAIAAL
jgi:hypothetical protein